MYRSDYDKWIKKAWPYPTTGSWKEGLPKTPGIYWLYSYRYGKKHAKGKELQLLEVNKISNGVMHVADGQFVFPEELEEPIWRRAILPVLPREEKNG